MAEGGTNRSMSETESVPDTACTVVNLRLYHPGSGRCLNMFSTEPGVQVYTGGHMPDITGKGGNEYRKFASLCLESQHYPDSPNPMDDPNFPPVILRPGEIYTTSTYYEFNVDKKAE